MGKSNGVDTVQCCFTSTEIVRTIRDGEPGTATSTFTQFLSSERAHVIREGWYTSGTGSGGGSGATRLCAYTCARASSVT